MAPSKATGGALTEFRSVVGSGTVKADAGASLVLNGSASHAAVVVVNNGIVALGVGDNLSVHGSVDATSTGTFNPNNSSVLVITKMSRPGSAPMSERCPTWGR
jgi:hypothetical protein